MGLLGILNVFASVECLKVQISNLEKFVQLHSALFSGLINCKILLLHCKELPRNQWSCPCLANMAQELPGTLLDMALPAVCADAG